MLAYIITLIRKNKYRTKIIEDNRCLEGTGSMLKKCVIWDEDRDAE